MPRDPWTRRVDPSRPSSVDEPLVGAPVDGGRLRGREPPSDLPSEGACEYRGGASTKIGAPWAHHTTNALDAL